MDAKPLELCFSSPWMFEAEAEPDDSAWSAGEPQPLAELDESGWDELGIPGCEGEDALQTDAWNLTTELRASSRALAAAALVPMLLGSMPALATEPAADTSAPAMQPVEITAPTMPAETTAAPAVQPTPDDGSSIWSGLVDRIVQLTLADGTTFRGTVLGVTDGKLVCAQASDGLMVIVDPALITTVHVQGLPGVPVQKRPPDGQGLIVFGSIALSLGGALAIATVAVAADCLNSYGYLCTYMTLPLGITSAVNLAVGIPLLVAGKRNRKRARAEQDADSAKLSAFVAPSGEGVMGGVGIRF